MPPLILMAYSLGIANEKRPDLIFDAEVDHMPGRFMALVTNMPLGTLAHFVPGSLQSLPSTRVLLASGLPYSNLPKLLAALMFEGTDPTSGHNERPGGRGSNGRQMDSPRSTKEAFLQRSRLLKPYKQQTPLIHQRFAWLCRSALRPGVLRPATRALRHRHASWTLQRGRGDDSGHQRGRPFQRRQGCGLRWERRAPARGAFRLTATSFVDQWEHILSWIRANPSCSSGDIFRELQSRFPGCYQPQHLRSLPRGMRRIRAHGLSVRS